MHAKNNLASAVFLGVLALPGGCGSGGGGDGVAAPMPPPPATCASASAWNGSQCVAYATRKTERAATPFFEDGQPVSLEVVIFQPLGPGPYPALMFHHGSTGNGDDPALFKLTYTHEAIARFFTEKGWLVAFPQRRGRGASGGRYDEGFEPDRSRYSCRQGPAFAGAERALDDADAALEHLRRHPDVDPIRILAGGHSRGGILAVAQAGRRVDAIRGAINFTGGWIGEGCVDSLLVNRSTFERGATSPHPGLWLYARNDSFYSIEHSQGNFAAFIAAGGRGSFRVHDRAAQLDGHFLPNDPQLWGADVAAYLESQSRASAH